MATVLTEPELETDANDEPDAEPRASSVPQPEGHEMDEALLVNRLPEWFRAPRALAGFVLVLGILYCFFNFLPVWHTDVWGHLAYGRMIAETRAIPDTEPFMPLSKGTPLVDTAWLSQVIGFEFHAAAGVTALQFLYGATLTACLGFFCWQCYRRGRQFGMCLFGLVLFLWAEWQAIGIFRPQLAGLLCFAVLLNLLTSRHWHRWNWVAVPVLFALWANLHGSFPVGLGLIATFGCGRAIDVFRRSTPLPCTKSLFAVFRDVTWRRSFLLFELAAVAVLLNPYGIGLYVEVVQFSSHPNLARLVEWSPLSLRLDDGRLSHQGAAAAAIAMLLIVLYRYTPRRVSAVEPLLLFGLGGAMLWTSRMIVWWSPVAAYYAVLHGGAVLRQWRRVPYDRETSPSKSLWAVLSIGMVWIAFAYTPFGMHTLHGQNIDPEKQFSSLTPYAAAEYLREHPPRGQVFNTLQFGDYLVWNGPDDLQPFVTSHAHLVPKEVMDDYFSVVYLDGKWEALLDRYGVNTIVLAPGLNERLTAALKKKPEWKTVFADNRSVIFVRRQAI